MEFVPLTLATKLLPLAIHIALGLPAAALLNHVWAAVDSHVPVKPLLLPLKRTLCPPTVEIVPEPVRLPLNVVLPVPLLIQPTVDATPLLTVTGPE